VIEMPFVGSVATLYTRADRNLCRANLRLRHGAKAQIRDKGDKKHHVRQKMDVMQIAFSSAQQIERKVNPQRRSIAISAREWK
jgi:hypothetical protein